MPRNSSGTMSPANGPYIGGTTISTVAVNARFADIETEITDSASRSGKGGFTAPVRTADGTVAAPAHSFTAEPGSGLYRAGAGDVRLSISGADLLTHDGLNLTVSDAPFVQTVKPNSRLRLFGNRNAADAGNDVEISSTVTRMAGLLLQVQNSGTVNGLSVDYNGLVRLASQAAPIQPASLWTAITPATGYTATLGLAYWKDANGIVHVKGGVTAGVSAGNTLFTLPVGFRPAAGTSRGFTIYNGSNGTLTALVADTGVVSVGSPITNTGTSWLDVISFLAEQ